MCGLCGNYNGISGDDFIGRRKTNYSTAADFANSWQRDTLRCPVTSSPSNIIPIRNCLPLDSNTLRWINNQCEILKAYVVDSECNTIDDIDTYYNQCIDRLCSCHDPKICHCKLVRKLTKACEPMHKELDIYDDIGSICELL